MEMKKIIYASDAVLPSLRANAVHIMRMCDAFAENGVDVTLYCNDGGDVEKMYEVYGVRNHFHIVAPSQKKVTGRIQNYIKWILCAWRNSKSIRKNYKNAFVYGRSLFLIFFLGNKYPFSYEVHAVPNNRIVAMIERRLLGSKKLVSLVAISNPLKDYYSKLMPKELDGKIKVLHDGADIVDTGTVQKAVIDNSGSRYPNVNIGYVGSLYPGKCMEVLLPIAKAMADVKLHIVGGDEEWVKHWQTEADKKGINNLVFYGKVTPAEVASYYEALDICVMSYSQKVYVGKDTKHEIGQWISPLKLFEAMAHKKAIVVTDLPSIREVINDGEDAILIDASDINGWVMAIKSLAENDEMRCQLGENAQKKLENDFSWVKRTQKIISDFESL